MATYSGYSGPPRIVDYKGDTDEDYARGQNLYNMDDPSNAYDNVLRDRGINPYVANPFTQTLRSQARPIAEAYMMNRAGGFTGGGAGPQDRATDPYDYARWVQGVQAGGGAGAPGGTYATLRQAAQGIPDAIKQIRAYQQAQMAATSGNGGQQINPYMEALISQFGADNGMGAVAAQRLVTQPLMSRAIGQAYGTGLQNAGTQSIYNMLQQPTVDLNDDVWHWLYGI